MSIQHLGTMTGRELKEFVHERVVALLPVGTLQAHGPHLPLNTDVMISAETARRASRKLLSAMGKDVLVLPPLVFAPVRAGAKLPGTVHVAGDAFAAYLRGVLGGLAAAGLRTAALVNGHVDAAYLEAVAAAAPPEGFRVVAPDLTQPPWLFLMPEEFRKGAGHGGHFETSCLLAIDAEKVREDARRSLPAVEPGPEPGPQGYRGNPAGATSAHGEDYLEALATIVVDALQEGKA
jgi:creatinine amidohydrolase